MTTKVIMSVYQKEAAPHTTGHMYDVELVDFDELRTEDDKIYFGRLEAGERVFVHVVKT